MGKIIVQIIII